MITYRDKFLVALDKFVNTTLFNMDAKSVVQSVETATAKTITKKSPNWVYDKIANELNRHRKEASLPMVYIRDLVKNAKNSAEGKDTVEQQRACVFGAAFNRMMSVLKSSYKEYDARYPYMELHFEQKENGVTTVTGYCTDGYRILKHTENCLLSGSPFVVRLRQLQLKPKDELVMITPEKDQTTVSFGNVSFSFNIPAAPNYSIQELFQGVAKDHKAEKAVCVNTSYLRQIVNGMVSGNSASQSRVFLELDSGTRPIKLSDEQTEAFLLPIRCSKN